MRFKGGCCLGCLLRKGKEEEEEEVNGVLEYKKVN